MDADFSTSIRFIKMSKLFSLKKWVTVPEAAKRLSISCGEEIDSGDILRLALDGHLKLSVHLVNHARARCGRPASWEESDWELIPRAHLLLPDEFLNRSDTTETPVSRPDPPKLLALRGEIPSSERDKFISVMRSINIDGEQFVTLSDDVMTLRDVWDLPMVGAERLDVEHMYQALTGGPAVTLTQLEGAFVEGLDGSLCQLQEHLEANDYQAGSLAELERLNRRISKESLPHEESQELLRQHAEERKVFIEKLKTQQEKDCYYPAGSLPADSVLVIRTAALLEFEASLADIDDTKKSKPAPRDNSLVATIAALLSAWPAGAIPSGKDLEKAAQAVGLDISDDTLRKALKAAREAAPSLPLPK